MKMQKGTAEVFNYNGNPQRSPIIELGLPLSAYDWTEKAKSPRSMGKIPYVVERNNFSINE